MKPIERLKFEPLRVFNENWLTDKIKTPEGLYYNENCFFKSNGDRFLNDCFLKNDRFKKTIVFEKNKFYLQLC